MDQAAPSPESSCCEGTNKPQAASQSCCDSPPSLDSAGDASDALGMFKDFMKAANAPGLIDQRNKKLMAIMLSIAVRCTPCLKIHLKAALAMGISKAEIDEAAGLAIAFGGCSALMFYKEICDELKVN
jgi:AhpD family alkylhydroperoxidase